MGSGEPASGWRGPAVVILVWALFQAALAGTAFRIDEPTFLAIARQIAQEPLDPYGFLINWDYAPEPAFGILSNPPLVPAWLALFGRLFGWSERVMHLATLPFGALALAALASLARDFGVSARRATLLALASPAFLVASTVVMPDVAMLALVTAAVAAFMRWEATRSAGWWSLAAVVATLAPLAKYNGIVVVVPLLVLATVSRRRSLWAFLVAALPVMGILLWNAATVAIYGESHFGVSARFQGEWRFAVNGVLIGLGIALLPLPVALGRKLTLRVGGLYVAGFAAAMAVALLIYEYPPGSAAVFAVAITLAAGFLIRLVWRAADGKPLRGTAELALIGWFLATLALQFRLLFTAPRYLLPLLPAAILLAMLHGSEPGSGWKRRSAVLLAAGLAISFTTALFDAREASSYRTALPTIVTGSPGRLLASGHWGFQYYADEAGAEQINALELPALRPGDRVLIARAPFPRVRDVVGDVTLRSVPLTLPLPLVTYSCVELANFHGGGVGSCNTGLRTAVPFAYSTGPFDRIDVYDVGPGGARLVASE